MRARPFTIVGLGEVLWDLFPAGKELGGAPANFAYITNILGDRGIVTSRVGNDALGREVCQRFQSLQLETEHLQKDDAHPTGTVQVEVDRLGHAKYAIAPSVAWDFLEWTAAWRVLAQQADAVCFGSLAQRSAISRKTIRSFLAEMRKDIPRVFDVNLRQSYYSAEILSQSAQLAHIVKLNHEELRAVVTLFGADFKDELSAAQWLRAKYDCDLLCVTRGSRGSLLVGESSSDEHPGFQIKVADTVGAGDAFMAALVHHYLRGATLRAMNEAANSMGAWVASQPGGTPRIDEQQLRRIPPTNPQAKAI